MALPVRSIEADSMNLGPGARLFYTEADPLGRVTYRVENRRERTAPFGPERAEAFWAVLDQVLTAAFFRPPAVRLRALAAFAAREPRVFLFGDEWGTVVEGEMGPARVADPLAELRALRLSVCFAKRPDWIGLRFCMNIHHRDLFSRECLAEVDGDHINTLEIFFDTPSGEFAEAALRVQDKWTQHMLRARTLSDFPLVWIPSPLLESKGDSSGRTAPTGAEVEEELFSRRRRAHRFLTPTDAAVAPQAGSGATLADAAKSTSGAATPTETTARPTPSIPKPPRPRRAAAALPPTTGLPDHEMIAAARAEPDDERRWAILEQNLRLNSAGRTYQILAHFGDLVAQRASAWPADLLVSLLGAQPGSLLAPIVAAWPLRKVMALAEHNPEGRYLTDWLREREVERLLAMDPAQQIKSKAAAAQWLGLGETVSSEEVKQTWRRLLGFLRGDFGRRTEQAVHRKKDEIAKRLQQARDLLVKNR